ncbi:baseplate J tail protein [Nostoc phage N1]|nr:baseplate J tail protein [Nostoc phage N1]
MSDLNAPQLVIDDYQQLIIDSLVHTNVVSNGEFTDLDPSGFMRPFAGTMAYAGSELLYKANQSSIAAAKSFFKNVLGVENNVGTKATCEVQFGLSTSLATDFIVPINFQISDTTGTLRFYTTGNLVIPSGATTGVITAIAEEIGEKYNVSAGFISQFPVPLTYLEYAINITPATNGSSGETITNLIERCSQIIRIRNPVSALDFEQLAELVMGDGSRCKAIGLLGIDKIIDNPQPGVVHLFLLDKTGNPAQSFLISTVGATIQPRIMLGTRLLISPMETYQVTIDLIALSDGSKTFDVLAQDCFEAIQNYFAPINTIVGADILIEEVKFAIRSVGGLSISYLQLNDDSLNVPMPNQWTIPKFASLSIELTDSEGNIYRDNLFTTNPDE